MKGIAHYNEGEQVNHYLLVKSSSKGLTSGGKPFLTLILQDQTGDIEGKLWDSSPQDEHDFIPDTMVKVEGDITTFRGKNQLRIKGIRLVTSNDQVKKADLVMSAPLSVNTMLDKVTQYIFEIKNPAIQRITRALLKKHQDAFFEFPAAVRNHHEYVSGLAYHVVSMLNLAKGVAGLYPSLDTDLLYAGIILHDMGKVTELSGATAASYTLEGKLLGHISIMVNEIAETAKEIGVDGEEVVILQHMVLSHHSKPEWGSPKPPLVKEAEILHMLDNLDAKMNMMDRALEKAKPGDFTERLFALDNRTLYRPQFESKLPVE
ncbi:3'-5' exoribonuclease [Scopulibacillus darangshiensis]|uniref:3'-5' exoribonuclease n=1 Tax=Scopulibacillus darangshiensis TaxID=442528 RepID=A0A4R2P3K6_9BACL|nr:3'-5' exoribonuclease YhaM [Scopulibacillus darangshiensis]TCP29283.1 3'-5' exoribonuclease [Scopulibacillus darangshiensis]